MKMSYGRTREREREKDRDSASSRDTAAPRAKCTQVDSAGKVTLKVAAGPCWRGEVVFRKRARIVAEKSKRPERLDRATTLGILLPSSPKVLVLCKVEPHSQSQGRNTKTDLSLSPHLLHTHSPLLHFVLLLFFKFCLIFLHSPSPPPPPPLLHFSLLSGF